MEITYHACKIACCPHGTKGESARYRKITFGQLGEILDDQTPDWLFAVFGMHYTSIGVGKNSLER